MKDELISIIVPVHNAERFIEDTIQSVRSQTVTNWELILVDDGSTDSSAAHIETFVNEKIHLISLEKGHGAAFARNTGLDAAKGRYIAFLDADDLWDPEKLALQMAFMKEKHAGFTYTGYEFADLDGIGVDKIVQVPNKLDYRQALRNTTIFTSTVLFDTQKLPVGLLHMPEVPSEDTATWWQILRSGYTAYGLNRALTLYRRSTGTLSSNKLVAVKRVWNLYRNVEKLNLANSIFCFCFYAVHAVWRRL